jgi:DNA-binding protein HU-beta
MGEFNDDIVCVTRYCPNCGSEIFCRTDQDKHRVFYISEDLTDPTRSCPQCEFNLFSIPFEDLLDDPHLAREGRYLPHKVQAGKRLVEKVFQGDPGAFDSKAAAKRAVNAVGSALADFLSRGENVRWSGLGSFKVKQRAPRKGRNPRTGEELRIPATKAVRFVPAKALKERLNK